MGRLTGGHIKFQERRKIGDYEHRDCEIILTFSFEEGGFNPSFFDGLQHEIRARVQDMVANKDSPVPVKSSWAKAVDAVAEEPAIELPKPKRGRRPKTPTPALDELPEDDGPVGDPTTIDDVIDEDDDEETVGQAAGPSVDDVVTAVKEKNKTIGDPVRLKALIKKYAMTSREIPADKRAEFLEALKKFK